jgi:hypothetical protein
MENQIKTTVARSAYKRLSDDSAISIVIFDKDLGDGEFESYVRIKNEASGRPVPMRGRPYTLEGEIPLSSWLKLLGEAESILSEFKLLKDNK